MRRPWLRPAPLTPALLLGVLQAVRRADRQRALGVSFRDRFLSGLFLGRQGKKCSGQREGGGARDGGAEGDGEAEWVPVSEGGGTRAGRLDVRELAAGMSYNGRG